MSPSDDLRTSVVPPRANRVLARRRRQTLTFLGLFGFVVLIGFVALGNWEGWWTIGGRAEAATVTCPVQVVSEPDLTAVNVVNGTQRHGLAAAVAREMQYRGFQVVAITTETPAKPIESIGFVRYGPLGRTEAHTVALEFPGKIKLVNDKRKSTTVDLVLGEKYKSMVSRAKGNAAIAPKPDPDGCIEPTVAATTTAAPATTPPA